MKCHVKIHIMQATGWKLEEAIQLFYIGNEGGLATEPVYSTPRESDLPLNGSNIRYIIWRNPIIYP